ncbi:MAG: hypothetical protein ACTHNU_08940 [Gaiellales bacterium]|jgi:hypothetical protein
MGSIFIRTTWRERLVMAIGLAAVEGLTFVATGSMHAAPIFAVVYLLAARVVISRRRSHAY